MSRSRLVSAKRRVAGLRFGKIATVGFLGLAGLALLLTSCTFYGYVPADPPAKPLAESEAHIADLAVGDSVEGDLDCPAGRCRVRYRIIAPGSGVLTVRVEGPGGTGHGEQGPRLARAVLEGVGQQTLVMRGRAEGPPPFELSHTVQPGVHYILIQGLGGPLDYTVSASFAASAKAVTEPGTDLAVQDPAPGPPHGGTIPVVPLPKGYRDEPGDLSDGADFIADPNTDVSKLRKYAFAQDPAAMLKGEPGSIKGNVFILREVQREVRYYLADQGRYDVPSNEAEFLIAIGVGAKSTTWYSANLPVLSQPYDYYFDLWGRTGLAVRQHTYQDGTLMIDFIDPKTGDLLWHGWAVEPIPISEDNRKIIKKAVAQVLGQL